jgi:hypothetical protein
MEQLLEATLHTSRRIIKPEGARSLPRHRFTQLYLPDASASRAAFMLSPP